MNSKGGFGFSKAFVIFLFLAIAVAYGTRNWYNGFVILAVFAIIKIIWNILT